MTIFPGRIGGTRGPDNRTLTDLYNQMVALTDGVTALSGTMATVLERLTYISGTSPVEDIDIGPSLIALLQAVTGGYSQYSSFNTRTLKTLITDTSLGFTAANRVLSGQTSTLNGQNVLNDIKAQLVTVIAAIDGVETGAAQQLTTTAAILASLGTITTPPDAVTVKELLFDLLACCEGGGGGGFSPAPPALGCSGDAPAWVECPLQLVVDGGGVGDNIYMAQFPAAFPNNGQWTSAVTGTGATPLNALVPAGPAPYNAVTVLCMHWTFSTGNGPAGWGLETQNNIDGVNPALAVANDTPPLEADNGTSYSVGVGLGPTNTRYGARFYISFDPGTTPDGKVWASLSDEPV